MAKSQHAATDVVAVADRCPVNAAADDAGFAVSTLHTDATRAELVAVGQLDLATADVLTAALMGQLRSGRRYLRLDGSAMSFCDCAGLGALLAAHHHFLDARGRLILTGASPRLRRLLQLTALDTVVFLAADIAAVTGPAAVAGGYTYADVIERLFGEFEDRISLTVIVEGVRECREQLSCVPESAMPEMLERLTRQRLSSTPQPSPSVAPEEIITRGG